MSAPKYVLDAVEAINQKFQSSVYVGQNRDRTSWGIVIPTHDKSIPIQPGGRIHLSSGEVIPVLAPPEVI